MQVNDATISDTAKKLQELDSKLYVVRRSLQALEDEEKQLVRDIKDANALMVKAVQLVTGYSPKPHSITYQRFSNPYFSGHVYPDLPEHGG